MRSFKNRTIAALILVLQFLQTHAQRAGYDALKISADKVNSEIWNRFVNQKTGLMYDYTDQNKTYFIPTAEEAKKMIPNAQGWGGVPTEDGAFFSGLYLDALCERWKRNHDKITADKATLMASGLMKLGMVSDVPGFIARNILEDGSSHYVAGSDDQTFPWFYGLWKYLNSGIPTKAEHIQIGKMLTDKAAALQKRNWEIPCDPDAFGFFGTFKPVDRKYPHLVRIPFIERIVFEITKDEYWLKSYQESLNEIPVAEEKTRLELLASGVPYGKPGENKNRFWLTASSQAALRELYFLEKDEVIKQQFKKGMMANAENAITHVRLSQEYDNNNTLHYDLDWRFMIKYWRPQTDSKDARALGTEQLKYCDEISPRKPYEYKLMVEPLFAAWVVTLCEDPALFQSAKSDLEKALLHYTWEKLYCAPYFIAEVVFFEKLKMEKKQPVP